MTTTESTVLEYLESYRPDTAGVPQLSLEAGTAGLVYAGYVLGAASGEVRLLAAAHRIGQNAVRFCGDPRGYVWRYPPHPFSRVAHESVLHGPIGTAMAFALIARANGDAALEGTAIDELLSLLQPPFELVEFGFGAAGALWAANKVLRARVTSASQARALRCVAAELYGRAWAMYGLLRHSVRQGSEPDLRGFAHGRAGILFAFATHHLVNELAPTPRLLNEFESLAVTAEVGERGVSWSPVQPPDESDPWPGMRESWCNGVAGFVPLWSAANRLTGAPVYRLLALKSAAYLVRSGAELFSPSLCCGLAGHAVALRYAQELEPERDWDAFVARTLAYCGVDTTLELTHTNDGLLKQGLGVFLGGRSWL